MRPVCLYAHLRLLGGGGVSPALHKILRFPLDRRRPSRARPGPRASSGLLKEGKRPGQKQERDGLVAVKAPEYGLRLGGGNGGLQTLRARFLNSVLEAGEKLRGKWFQLITDTN